MADSDQIKPKPKRVLKNPETFRQRALRAAENKELPKRDYPKTKKFFTSIGKLFMPIVKGYRRLEKIKQLKYIFKFLSFLSRILFIKYAITSLEELKKVTWPTFKESRKLTYAVLIFAIVFGASVALVDYGLGKIFKQLLLK